jgi:hypothetical protein
VFPLLLCYSVQFVHSLSCVVVQLQCLPPAFLLSNNKSESPLDIMMFSSFSMLPYFCCLYMWNFILVSSRGPLFCIFIIFIISCMLPYSYTPFSVFGVGGFLAVSDIVFVSFNSASNPSAGLSCELTVACVIFQLLYMLLWNWSCWLLWAVRFCIVMLSSIILFSDQGF